METLTVTTKISPDGKLTLEVPEVFKGAVVTVTCHIEKEAPRVERDQYGWPKGFWDRVYGSITDPAFRRPEQGVMEPIPSFE
jgi:hypothetical protein